MTKSKLILASIIAATALAGCDRLTGDEPDNNDGGGKTPLSQLPQAEGVFHSSAETGMYFTPYAEVAGPLSSPCVETYNDYYFESENFLVYGPRSLSERNYGYAAYLVESAYEKMLPKFGMTDAAMEILRPGVSGEFMGNLNASGIFGGLNSIHMSPSGEPYAARILFNDISEFQPEVPGAHLSYEPLDENGDLIADEKLAANHFYAWFSTLTHDEQVAVVKHRIPDSLEEAIRLTKESYGPDEELEGKLRSEIIEPQRAASNGPFGTGGMVVTEIDLVPQKYVVCLNPHLAETAGNSGESTFYGMNLIPFSYYDGGDLSQVVDHEMVHMITANISHRLTDVSQADAWWEEGVAVALSGQKIAHHADTPLDVTRFTLMGGVFNSGTDISDFYAHSGLAVTYLMNVGNTVEGNFVDMLMHIRGSEKSFQLTDADHYDDEGNYISKQGRETHAFPAFEQAFDATIITNKAGEMEGLDTFKTKYSNRAY